MPFSMYHLPTAPILLYDGLDDGWLLPLALLQSDGTLFPATISKDVRPISQAREFLGKDDFRLLLLEVRAQVRDWSGQGDMAYLGAGGLHLHFVRNGPEMWVLAAGERPPARYQTYLHGHWRLGSEN